MDYQYRIELLKRAIHEYELILNKAETDRAEWVSFDNNENFFATFGGTPGAIVNALDDFIDKVEGMIARDKREIQACEDVLAGRIEKVEL